jgi:competence protein ComEC
LDGVRYIASSQFISDKNNGNLSYEKTEVEGKFYFKSGLYPRYNYGDKLRITCILKKPEPVEDFRYDKYLARYNVFVDCSPLKIEKIGESAGNIFLEKIFAIKAVIAGRINKLWHEPYASFMAGLLYGYRGGLGTLNDLFSRTGVTHIVAISGYNITIISTILIALCTRLYIPRKKAFWLIIFGIFVFVIFAGASASVVRAGIMGVIVLLTKQVGRKAQVSNVMILTALIMTLQNPYILVWDVGFQLSFISTLGLVYLVPILEKYFTWVPEKFSLRDSLVTTLGAIVATLPLILYQFNRLSVVSPIVNIFILWILPWIMFAGFFVVVAVFILIVI